MKLTDNFLNKIRESAKIPCGIDFSVINISLSSSSVGCGCATIIIDGQDVFMNVSFKIKGTTARKYNQ